MNYFQIYDKIDWSLSEVKQMSENISNDKDGINNESIKELDSQIQDLVKDIEILSKTSHFKVDPEKYKSMQKEIKKELFETTEMINSIKTKAEKEFSIMNITKSHSLENLMKASEKAFKDEPIENRAFFLDYASTARQRSSMRKELDLKLDWSECIKDPKNHPEWNKFKNSMMEHIKDEAKIEKLWKLTIFGIDKQLTLNANNQKSAENIHFKELSESLAKEGLLGQIEGQPLAFWCGGFDVSLYAQEKNFTTLEKTKAGRVFDNLLMYPDWKPLGPLWNNLSSSFASEAKDDIHVFFRIQDPFSVLERQEIPELQKGLATGKVANIIFHPLINQGAYGVDDLDMKEIKIEQQKKDPTELESTIEDKDRKLHQLALKNTLVKIYQSYLSNNNDNDIKELLNSNIFSIKQMKLE